MFDIFSLLLYLMLDVTAYMKVLHLAGANRVCRQFDRPLVRWKFNRSFL